MTMPDDFEDQRPSQAPKNLTEWNIEDLQNYIANLKLKLSNAIKLLSKKR